MIRAAVLVFFIARALLITPVDSLAQDGKTYSSEGAADIHGNDLDAARAGAAEDAQRRALDQAIALLIGTRTRIENNELISGKILSQTRAYIKLFHITGETTDSGLLRVSITAEIALDRLSKDLSGIGMHLLAAETVSTRTVNITIMGLNKTQLEKFNDVLRKEVRGIKGVQERSFGGTTAKISVDSKNSAQLLSDELLLKDFGTFAVEIVGSTANSLELKVKPK